MDDLWVGFVDVKWFMVGDFFDFGVQCVVGRVEVVIVCIWVSGNEVGVVGDEEGGFMYYFLVKGVSFFDDDKIWVYIGNGKVGFVQFVDQCFFFYYVGFFVFLVMQKIGGGYC